MVCCCRRQARKPQEAAKVAASAVKSAVPDQPQEAAKDAASAAKDSLPEPPKDIPNPFQSIFGEACWHAFPVASDFCVRHPVSDAPVTHSFAQLTSHSGCAFVDISG